jgi:hypothetical protein
VNYLKRNRGTVLAVIAVWALAASVPAIAHGVNHALFAHQADKVDGKHAVGAGAGQNARAGKLVATNAGGKLPTNIVGGLMRGPGVARPNRLRLLGSPGGTDRTFFRFPQLGRIGVSCSPTAWSVEWTNPAGVTGYWRADYESPGSPFVVGQRGGNQGNVGLGDDSPTAQILIQAGSGSGVATRLYTVWMTVVFDEEGDECFFHGEATTHGVPIHLD